MSIFCVLCFINPIALRKAKTLWSFGLSECNTAKYVFWHLIRTTSYHSEVVLRDYFLSPLILMRSQNIFSLRKTRKYPKFITKNLPISR